jgi:sulfite exporter TauE/SafE/plastocyanin domain-containing protein/copper chaperone CopZ
MHCRSCEILLEDAISQVPHVKKCEVDWRGGAAQIYYSPQQMPSKNEIAEAIRAAGYDLGKAEKQSFFSKNIQDYKELGIAFLFLAGAYFILRGLNLPGINLPTSSSAVSLWAVVLIGLTAGFSTCLALVGGLVLGVSAKYVQANPQTTPREKFRPHLLFNLGRIGGYMFFGALLGALGSVLQLSSFVTGIITVLVGAVMLIMGLQLTNIVPGVNRLKILLPKGLSRVLGIQNNSGKYSDNKAMLLGASTFFLPCGFTQAMQLYAISSGSVAAGILIMGLFALGTAPGLLSIGGLVASLKKTTTSKFFKFAGVVVVALAMFNISNGFNLTGWSGSLSALAGSFGSANQTAAIENSALPPIENGKQIVKMAETDSGYSPNEFTVKKGVPVRWIIDAQAPYSCASSLVMSKFNIRKNLVAGENIIEFTPTETGNINFSCSMGMYRGSFSVVDGNDVGATATKASNSNSVPGQITGGSCGGGSTGGGCGGCGGGAQIKKDVTSTVAKVEGDVQIINATYTAADYLQPNSFRVKAGSKVRLTIDVKDDGRGCGYAIMIPGLYNNAVPLQAGQAIIMEFTPTAQGSFSITCGMRMINYGTIVVE